MSDALETTGPADSPVRSTTSVLLLLAGLVAVPVLLLMFVLLRGTGTDGIGDAFADSASDDRIQAVYLTNDEVFFGTLGDAEGDVLVLRDAFFLRRSAAEGDDEEAADSVNLVSVAQDVGGDGDLVINAAEVVRIQDLTEDAEIAKTIEAATK